MDPNVNEEERADAEAIIIVTSPDGPPLPPPRQGRSSIGAESARARTLHSDCGTDLMQKRWESTASNKRLRVEDEDGAMPDAATMTTTNNDAGDGAAPADKRAVTPFESKKSSKSSHSSAAKDSDPELTWNAFWEQESRLQRVLGDALDSTAAAVRSATVLGVGSNAASSRTRPSGSDHESQHFIAKRNSHMEMARVAHAKSQQVLDLQRQLSQAQSQLAGLDAANATIREENRQLQIRMDKTAQALRIAGQNATKARNDATHAEATASALAEKLEAFQGVVKETHRSMQALGHDHKQVTDRAHTVEMQLVQALAKEATLVARCRMLESRNAAAEGKLQESKKAEQAWRTRYDASQESIQDLQLQLDRANGFNSSRRAHSEQIAKDLQQTLALLEASTRANQESEDTLRQLQDANRQLQEQVEGQSTELAEYRTKSQRDKERLNESYTNALSKAQQLEMQLEMLKATVAAKEEEWKHERKLLLANNQSSKRVKQTATTAATAAEGDSQASIPPSTPSSAVRIPSLASISGSSRGANQTSGDRAARVVLPKLGGGRAVAATTGLSSQTCCVCSKPASYGIIKTCQCGRDQCFMRAHAACASHHSLSSTSSSDPGSDRLILCGGAGSAGGGGGPGDASNNNDASEDNNAPSADD